MSYQREAGRWNDWIYHDGSVCPLLPGTYAEIELCYQTWVHHSYIRTIIDGVPEGTVIPGSAGKQVTIDGKDQGSWTWSPPDRYTLFVRKYRTMYTGIEQEEELVELV